MKEEARPDKTVGCIHSWCEFADEQNRTVVVDYNSMLIMSNELTLTGMLIVEHKESLPHVYLPKGRRIGRFIFLKSLPPIIIRLRLKQV